MAPRWAIRTALIAVGLLLCAASSRYQWPVAVATIGLLYITFEYLLTTRDSLDLLRNEAKRREKVFLFFDLGIKEKSLWLRVSNLGLSNILLQVVHVRKPDSSKVDSDLHRIVEHGKTEHVRLPDDLFKHEGFCIDLEETLNYLSLDGASTTMPKCFAVMMRMADRPKEVNEGLDDFWHLRCPKCPVPAATNVYGLKTFEAADERKKRVADDLAASCPNHKSEFFLTVEAVRAQREEKKLRPRESLSWDLIFLYGFAIHLHTAEQCNGSELYFLRFPFFVCSSITAGFF